MDKLDYRYTTDRLLIAEWHSVRSEDWNQTALSNVVMDILTANVTQSLPPAWQGIYNLQRASEWIQQRDAEGVTSIIINKSTRAAIGFVILSADDSDKDLRFGYLLNESSWGKGYGSELVSGFVEWSKKHGIRQVTGGVDTNNLASIHILEKNGFIRDPEISTDQQQILIWRNE